MMTSFDEWLIHAMSRIDIHSPLFVRAAVTAAEFDLTRGLPLVTLLWWIWFRPERQIGAQGEAARRQAHELVIAAIVSGLIALAIGRLLAHELPFRLRPIFEPQLHAFYPPPNAKVLLPRTWSSFPSDHAMLWGAVATAILFASRPVGIYALLHVVVLICLPRLYLGLHYPTDLLAGLALGVGIACLVNVPPIRALVSKPVLAFAERCPGLFYGAAFLLSFELATQFDELRLLAFGLTHIGHYAQ
ncbi:MAG TPA: phosphatase PAP2 family protein [Trinickia sp.]|jgi:undecaprenyl-diphosphatase|uniref:phosphatase PAP2 family protein n=1 Tax=Trinickia sp. TaxID=2571163 RepID=UPI002C3B9976|nr:phosphatase PAP2 family protein [Trinickia sp.]HVW50392.1 phosphatase PAP2 family protein [Trinickia sp.]